MTILSKKKGSGSKNDEAGDIPGPLQHGVHNHPIPHPQLQLQPEGLNGGFANERSSSSSMWGQGQREELRGSQPHYDEYEHIDGSSNHGKRRHRVSPMRSTRIKHSRVERERSSSASPNTVGSGGMSPKETNSSGGMQNASSSDVNTYNSEDEYEAMKCNQVTEDEWMEKERRFEKKMRKKGFSIKKMGEDGACLFRAVADQVYGDQEMHSVVRKHCMDYIAKNSDYYSQYVTEDFDQYVLRKRLDFVHGNHIEIQAMSEMYNRTIEVFCYATEPINSFHSPKTVNDNEPIRLSYHRGVHYNSIVDPFKATIGVGLGLPGHLPGLADKTVLKEGVRQSEDYQIEQAMLEDKLRVTDWEATNEAIEEQVARESYLQWLKDNERRQSRFPVASSSSATATSASCGDVRLQRPKSTMGSPLGSPFRSDATALKNSPARFSPPPSTPGSSKNIVAVASQSPKKLEVDLAKGASGSPEHPFELLETATFMNQMPPEMFGLSEWEDAGILAKVLAASQQEYLDTLKRSRNDTNTSEGSS